MPRSTKKASPTKLTRQVRPPDVAPDPLAPLAGDILQRLSAAHASAVDARAEVGKLLLEVKSALAHGEWLPWLATHTPLTPATAKRAIQLHHLKASDPEAFAALRPLGLTKAYKLMAMAPEERDAFLSGAHAVPSTGATKTPAQMTFAEMVEVLHPPAPETKAVRTVKVLRGLRRQAAALERLVRDLWALVPSLKRAPLRSALATLDEALAQIAVPKSLIAAAS